ncbi:TetR/AcrR family transcriptional regulator [Marinicella sp. W31]|uniref:TetR/AcrR family transcriptional regulator n=1 Tax=Marinicella sp. W31 TaxID=3023713 RepID=UPI003757372F
MNKITRLTTSEAIIEAGFMVLNQNPKASLADIANTAGVGRATLHRYFSGRDNLIEAMSLKALKEMEQAADEASKNAQSYSEALHCIFVAMIPLGTRQWFLAQEHVQHFQKVKKAIDRQEKDMRNAVKKASKEGLFHPSCPLDWVMLSYDHMIHAAWEMVRLERLTVDQAAQLGWQTLIQGLQNANIQH